jgi:hypothetical protein
MVERTWEMGPDDGEPISSGSGSRSWMPEFVVEPARAVLAQLAVGQMSDADLCDSLSIGIDGLFRTEVAAQYRDWPPGWTTDGATIDVCRRPNRDVLERR